MSDDTGKNQTQLARELELLRQRNAELSRTEESLRESELSLNEAQHVANLGSWYWIIASDTVCWSQELYAITGQNPEFPPPSYEDHPALYTPESWERLSEAVGKAVQHGQSYEMELNMLRPDGTVRVTLTKGAPTTDEAGRVLRLVGTVQDITARKRAEEELATANARALTAERLAADQVLRRSKQDYCSLFEQAGDYIIVLEVTDDDLLIVDASESACNQCGYRREDLIGLSLTELGGGDAHAGPDDAIVKRILAGEQVILETVRTKKDGTQFDVEVKSKRLETASGAPRILSIERDISERKRAEKDKQELEAKVRQTQKLESLGILAGGIAHDFSNLLVGVLGNADLALASLEPSGPVRTYINGIRDAATQAADLANQMLAYSGKGQFIVKTASLTGILREMGHLLAAAIPKTAVLDYQLDDALPATEVDVTQVRQVIMNLVSNGAEALEGKKGTVTLTTGTEIHDETCPSGEFVAGECTPGIYAYLEVSDTGVGMNTDAIARMFDPFYTTKFTGRGLGLAALFGIVRGHKGAIRVDSAVGAGTRVRVLFPAAEKGNSLAAEKGNETSPDRETAECSLVGGGTVLLVDDDATVLEVGTRMLEASGYDVLNAGGGKATVKIFAEHAKQISCVILDLTMPVLDGEEVLRELQKVDASVPVILSSGFNRGDIESRVPTSGFAGFIKKPYSLKDLQARLREVLDG